MFEYKISLLINYNPLLENWNFLRSEINIPSHLMKYLNDEGDKYLCFLQEFIQLETLNEEIIKINENIYKRIPTKEKYLRRIQKRKNYNQNLNEKYDEIYDDLKELFTLLYKEDKWYILYKSKM